MMLIPKPLLDELVEHALEQAPLECCGLIGQWGDDQWKAYRATNIADSEVRFELDGWEQYQITERMDADGLALTAIYHSHTHAPPIPSESDIELHAYPDALCVIIGAQDPDRPVIRAWRIVEGDAVEVPLR